MNFLIITGYAPSLINFRFHLLKRLIKENYKITAISKISNNEYGIKKKLKSIGIDFLPIYITHKISNPILEVISIFYIGIRIIQLRPDKIFVYSPKPTIYTGLVIRLINKFPLIKKFEVIALVTGLGNTFSNFENNNLKNLLINNLAKFGFKKINKIIFQNSDDEYYLREREILNKDSKVFKVNGSGVDLEYFSYTPKNEQKQKVFLMLSRLIIDKGVIEYIKAAELIKKESIVLGSGGAARSVIQGLINLNFSTISVISRNKSSLDELIKNFGSQIEIQGLLNNDNRAQNLIEEADLIVNTTPVGMKTAKNEMNLLPYGDYFWRSLNSKTIVYDLIYNPAPTHLLKFSANKGCMTIDGLQMLVAQGLKSLSFWTNGLEVPFHIMNDALKNHL